MTALPNEMPPSQTDGLFTDMTQVCREIGSMIAQIETSLIDASQQIGGAPPTKHSLQQIDMVMQSVEEMALVIERLQRELPSDMVFDLQAIVGPTRLEWIRNSLAAGSTLDEPRRWHNQNDVLLF